MYVYGALEFMQVPEHVNASSTRGYSKTLVKAHPGHMYRQWSLVKGFKCAPSTPSMNTRRHGLEEPTCELLPAFPKGHDVITTGGPVSVLNLARLSFLLMVALPQGPSTQL